MADGLSHVIWQLEQRKAAIGRALEALRSLEGGAPAQESSPRRGGMSPEGKQRLIAALKRRWAARKRAAKKAAVAGLVATTPGSTPAKRKGGGMTPEGRRRLAEALKRRWAAKRAASAGENAGRKKAA
jgi:hypothetical protein